MKEVVTDNIYFGFRKMENYNFDLDELEYYEGLVLLEKEHRSFSVNGKKIVELYRDIETDERLYLTDEGEVFNSDCYDFVFNLERMNSFFETFSYMKLDSEIKLSLYIQYKDLIKILKDKKRIATETLMDLSRDLQVLYIMYNNITNIDNTLDSSKPKVRMSKVIDFNTYKNNIGKSHT